MNRFRIVVVALLLAACAAGEPSATRWSIAVDTLPSGIVQVTNTPPSAGDVPTWTFAEDLRIGSVAGREPATFGQLKDLVVDPAGRIIVLESQAQEIRVFGPDGAHLASWGGKGGGPGEFENALGIMQASDGLLYVPDQRNARMSVVSIDSGYVTSYPLKLYRWGFVWTGVMRDDDHILVPSMVFETRRDLVRIYAPDMTQVDSILLPERPPVDRADPPGAFAWQSADGRMRGFTMVPFYATGAAFLDDDGATWASTAGDPAYRVFRTSPGGDTTLVIETMRSPLPVAPAERDSALSFVLGRLKERGVNAVDESKVPTVKPTVLNMFTDEQDRLWVHTSSPDSLQRYDVYEPDGHYVGTLATALRIVPYILPVVRGDTMYAIVTDELDVQYVVRGSLRPATDP